MTDPVFTILVATATSVLGASAVVATIRTTNNRSIDYAVRRANQALALAERIRARQDTDTAELDHRLANLHATIVTRLPDPEPDPEPSQWHPTRRYRDTNTNTTTNTTSTAVLGVITGDNDQ